MYKAYKFKKQVFAIEKKENLQIFLHNKKRI